MESNNRTLIVGLGIIFLLVTGYFLATWQPERYEWRETYETESKHKNIKKPYDLSIIYSLLNGYFNDRAFNVMKDSLNEIETEDGELANYVYIGGRPYFDSSGIEKLFTFVEQGNTAFIAANNLPQNFIDKLYNGKCLVNYSGKEFFTDDEGDIYFYDENGDKVYAEYLEDSEAPVEEGEEFYYNEETEEEGQPKQIAGWGNFKRFYDTTVSLNFYHPTLQIDQPIMLKYGSRTNKIVYDWNYIHENTFCKDAVDYAELSYINDFKTNYIRIPFGNGKFLIHSTPLQFTDYQMVNEDGLIAANKVFTHLAEGDIYWDKIDYGMGSKFDFPKRNSDKTPLEYILSQPPLKWAWYLLLATVGCYLFFRAKRKQQIVPVLATKENSSLEFIKTVGRLYFLQNDHKKLASQKMKLFLSHVRSQYSIPTSEISTEMKERLASKAQVPIELVEEIFTRYKRLQRESQVSTSHLTNFHFAVEEFYQKSK